MGREDDNTEFACRSQEASFDEKPHPWAAFLDARCEAIKWMRSEGRSDAEITIGLSMDHGQVYHIRRTCKIE